MDIAKFFIVWGPTFLFVFIVLIGILFGCLRGFRKSLILFIHMIGAGLFCLILYLCMVNNPNLDANIVGFANKIMGNFGGNTIQSMMGVDSQYKTLHEILTQYFLTNMGSEGELNYYLILENAQYIGTLVDMAYHIVFAILCGILYLILIFLLYLIYLIFYPVRRKVRKENKKYHEGEVNHPYRKKRLLGCLVGGVRSIITAVIGFSFLGSLIFIVTGGTNMPGRDKIKEDSTVEFSDPTFNTIYDYYSYVCEMGNTGIFGVLNGIKDTNQTPFYFYFADLVLQGKIEDEALGIENEKFYLRDELGEYVHFINSSVSILLKYADAQTIENLTQNKNNEEVLNILISTMQSEGFEEEFNALIDSFEGKAFMNNLCLSALTSIVNHIDLVAKDSKELVGVVNQLFKSDDAIKVSDLATGADIKNLFKGVVSVVASIELEEEMPLAEEEDFGQSQLISTKQTIKIAQKFLPVIQNLSIFKERQEVGNKVIKGLYTFCSENLISEDMSFEVPQDLVWIDEFNILLNACDPLLTLAYEIFDTDQNMIMTNLAHIFDGENKVEMEKAYDALTDGLVSSNLLDVVFKSSFVGKYIDQMIVSITSNEEAGIPKNIDYVGKDGECSIFLKTLKLVLKNDGGAILLGMMESGSEIDSEMIISMIDMFTKPVEDDGKTDTILNRLLESKLLYYTISTYLTYVDLGSFKLYIPEDSIDLITEGTGENIKEYRMIKHSEITIITDLLSNCKDLIVNLIDHPDDIDYAGILTNSYIKNTVDESLLLQGTLANVIIGVSADADTIILPESYDTPEQWLNQTNTKGEISILLDAIYSLAAENKDLINDLMNGNISPKVLLDVDNSVLEKLCVSKILRYTISDMITALGSNDFEIVVARSSIEELNAKTTTEKTVNVINSQELYGIFVDIKSIVTFDEQDQIKVNYGAIFENKTEISENKTITATIAQMMMKYSDSGFLVVPAAYQTDFEKIKTDFDLTNNVWFGKSSSVADDELYLMLSAIETLIDKDENGKIPADFDLEALQTSLKLRKNGIDTLCSSAVLNASMTKQITNIFKVPEEQYINETIEKNELDAFFEAIFTMFNRDEIIVNELDDNLFNLEFRLESIDRILSSTILLGTISEKIFVQPELSIPKNQTYPITYIGNESGTIIFKEEMSNLFKALFSILNADVIAVNSMDNNLNSLVLDSSDIEIMFNSSILRATVSEKLTDNAELVVPTLVAQRLELVNNDMTYVVEQDELKSLFNALFVLLETESIEVNQLASGLQDFSLNAAKTSKVLESSILRATISKNFLQVEDLVIPDNTEEEIFTTKSEIRKWILKEELNAFFAAIFVTTGNDISGTSFDLSQMVLPTTSAQANTMTASLIISATLSNKIMGEDSIVIILDDLFVPYVLSSKSSSDSYIHQVELTNLLLALTNGMGKNDPTNLTFDTVPIPTTLEAKQALVGSEIIRATISEKVLNQENVTIELNSIALDTTKTYKGNHVGVLSGEEILNVVHGLELLSTEDGSFDNLIVDVDTILLMENRSEVLDVIANSVIYRAIISRTLGETHMVGGYEVLAYQLFSTTSPTTTITINGQTEIYNYEPLNAVSDRYVIRYPKEAKAVYTSFTLLEGAAYICNPQDILALEGLSR